MSLAIFAMGFLRMNAKKACELYHRSFKQKQSNNISWFLLPLTPVIISPFCKSPTAGPSFIGAAVTRTPESKTGCGNPLPTGPMAPK